MRIKMLPIFTILSLISTARGQDSRSGSNADFQNLPCVIKYNQLYCTDKGSKYPESNIDKFVDDNKALLKRMFGEAQEQQVVTQTSVTIVTSFAQTSFVASPFGNQFGNNENFQTSSGQNSFQRVRRDVLEGTWDEMIAFEDENEHESNRTVKRQADFTDIDLDINNNSQKSDVCDSKAEIVQPYWASNSNGKLRAILNNGQFEQAVHQEVCSQQSTSRCNRDCSCEQKYKWHRLLAYDPNNDCAGVFMDWFLFPSCCVCQCNNNPYLG